jgi:hypothetical protein
MKGVNLLANDEIAHFGRMIWKVSVFCVQFFLTFLIGIQQIQVFV